MRTYTAFCREATDLGTTWISSVCGVTPESAKKVAVEECAADWSMEPHDVMCIGLIAGDVDVVYWDDGGLVTEDLRYADSGEESDDEHG